MTTTAAGSKTYIFLQKRLSSEETVLTKKILKRYASLKGVYILRHHTDNGQFVFNGFIKDCQAENQHIFNCGVNAHFQNGGAEKKIRDLHEQTRTCLLYAIYK